MQNDPTPTPSKEAGSGRDKPILFSGPMVRAIIEGRKTQTRRVLKPQPITRQNPPSFSWGKFYGEWPDDWFGYGNEIDGALPYAPGDRLWVREAHYVWNAGNMDSSCQRIDYRATTPNAPCRWASSIHMPRWASRITLLVTEVRVQRLQEISEEDAKVEGIMIGGITEGKWLVARSGFAALWDSINAKRPGFAWADNRWVAAYTFKPILKNIDAVGASHD